MIDTLRGNFSVTKLCSALGFRRNTYYSRKAGNRPEEKDRVIAELLRNAAVTFVAWGFWMIFFYLRNQGNTWNHKKVYSIWKQEGLNLRKIPKRERLHREYLGLLAPQYVNEGWAMDFLSDWVVGEDGAKVRIINIMDECSRRALWTEAHKSITAENLIDILDKLAEWRGLPAYIRCDNGPEFIAGRLVEWAAKHDVELRYIQPGKPTQNGLIERLNKTLRAECLNLEWFKSIDELNEKIQAWSVIYNNLRPHKSLKRSAPCIFEAKAKFYFRPAAA